MTDETKILFEQLADAINANQVEFNRIVEAINSPDWWVIGITAVNAVIMVWLGWKQYKLQQQQTILQKRQTESQMFDTYRNLYSIIKEANFQIDNFLANLWKAEWTPTYQFDANFLKDRIDELSILCEKMSQSITEYELKFSKDFIDIKGYYSISTLMLKTYRNMDRLMSENKLRYIEGMQRISYNQENEDEVYINAISQQFINKGICQYIKSDLESFVRERNEVRNYDVLEKIRNRCKID